jgi:hypothetical protein
MLKNIDISQKSRILSNSFFTSSLNETFSNLELADEMNYLQNLLYFYLLIEIVFQE